MTDRRFGAPTSDIRDARRRFPATANRRYFNTAAVGLASRHLAETYQAIVAEWAAAGFDFEQAERSANNARSAMAGLIGANASDVALIPSVSSAAGLVAAQFGPANVGDNLVIGQREYSSNHFPWRQLAGKGYDVRQIPFRDGGIQPEDVARRVDEQTRLVAFSGVQSATGHRSDIAAISSVARNVGALVFVDGSQLVGALPVGHDLGLVDVLVTPDHKFLLNAGRGMGYCYFSPEVQQRFTPINAGWRAGAVPLQSFFGPDMTLSSTASRFDSSISWLAAFGNEAALAVFEEFGPEAIYARNHELATTLRAALIDTGCPPLRLPEANRSTLVTVPFGADDASRALGTLSAHDIVASARDGYLRLSIHFYNDEDDIQQLATVLSSSR